MNYEFVDRFRFYEQPKKVFAVMSTSQGAPGANIILKKGVKTLVVLSVTLGAGDT